MAWKRLRGPAGARFVGRYRAAERDPAATAQRAQRGLEVLAADVVEVHVDAVGRRGAELLLHRPVVVVERRVEAELVEEVCDLRRRARAADHAVPAQLGDLRRERADGARGGRDPDDIARAQLRGVQETGVGRQAHAAQRPEVCLGRRDRAVDPGEGSQPPQRRLACAHDGVLPPARGVPDHVAGGEAIDPGLDDLADGHDLVERRVQRERREVSRGP